VRQGSFLIYPSLELANGYDSNVFGLQKGVKSAYRWEADPSVDVESDWSRNALRFTASGAIGGYEPNSQFNYQDFNVTGYGRYDITGRSSAFAQLSQQRLHRSLSSPEAPTAANEPSVYYLSTGTAGFTQGFDRVTALVTGTVDHYNYNSVKLVNGTTTDQANQDLTDYTPTVRFGYEIQPGYQAFVQGSYTATRYDEHCCGTAPVNRDSNTYQGVAGTALNLTGLITGEVYVGYLETTYSSPTFNTFSGVAFGGSLNWAITQLTTVTGSASRALEPTNFDNSSGIDRILAQVAVDHELLRNLLLNATVQYRQDAYQLIPNAVGPARTDDYYTGAMGATYYLNRYLYLGATYQYQHRDSNIAGNNYDDNLFIVRLGGRL
jgi:hypothetical protein